LAGLSSTDVANLDKAVANAEQVAQEVIAALRGGQQQSAEVSS
jgi:hypothetical protein